MSHNYLEPLVQCTSESDQRLVALSTRLGTFYNTFRDYPAFAGASKQTVWLELVAREVQRRHQNGGSVVRVLEAGAGAGSMFSEIDGLNRSAVHYTAQDITSITSHRLAQVADAVHIGPLRTLEGQFDIIFSLFVLEHISEPDQFLSEIDRLLVPGGTHIVICPRYDFPGYICPSMRHMNRGALFRLEAFRALDIFRSRLHLGTHRFWINTEPAVLHRKWVRDADAVHIVSKPAVKEWHLRRGYSANTLMPRSGELKDWFVKRFLILSLALKKPA
jgi:2-polyprenyl-3-methyl-5-hydroxy-6-metoxy-1,4-benzoquinol methylase